MDLKTQKSYSSKAFIRQSMKNRKRFNSQNQQIHKDDKSLNSKRFSGKNHTLSNWYNSKLSFYKLL